MPTRQRSPEQLATKTAFLTHLDESLTHLNTLMKCMEEGKGTL